MFPLPPNSPKAKGAALALKVTQYGALLGPMLQGLKSMVEKSTAHESDAYKLQIGQQKMLKDLQKAHKKIWSWTTMAARYFCKPAILSTLLHHWQMV